MLERSINKPIIETDAELNGDGLWVSVADILKIVDRNPSLLVAQKNR